MKMFTVPVRTFREARLLLSTLADYDRFQFENRIKPDYCNAGGLQAFDPDDTEDGPYGYWSDYYPDSGDEFDDLTDEQIDELDAQRNNQWKPT
jgi:hypothetical protein